MLLGVDPIALDENDLGSGHSVEAGQLLVDGLDHLLGAEAQHARRAQGRLERPA